MGITYVQGDLLVSPADALVVPVNCVGVAGCGLALQCKWCYPEWFQAYSVECQTGMLTLGYPAFHCLQNVGKEMIVSFPTKYHFREISQVGSLHSGLKAMTRLYEDIGIGSIAFPKLGCGAGGLSWGQVKPLMESYLKCWLIDVLIYI